MPVSALEAYEIEVFYFFFVIATGYCTCCRPTSILFRSCSSENEYW